VNNLLKENNVIKDSAIVQDGLVLGWTCNTDNSRGKLRNEVNLRPLLLLVFSSFAEESSPMPPSSVSSGFSDDDSLRCDSSQSLTISQFVECLLKKKRGGLAKEYDEIKNRSPDGTFIATR